MEVREEEKGCALRKSFQAAWLIPGSQKLIGWLNGNWGQAEGKAPQDPHLDPGASCDISTY